MAIYPLRALLDLPPVCPGFPRFSPEFPGIPRNSPVFPGIPRNSGRQEQPTTRTEAEKTAKPLRTPPLNALKQAVSRFFFVFFLSKRTHIDPPRFSPVFPGIPRIFRGHCPHGGYVSTKKNLGQAEAQTLPHKPTHSHRCFQIHAQRGLQVFFCKNEGESRWLRAFFIFFRIFE